jgi:integrase
MATVKLYQRLNTRGFPIVSVDYSRNGIPIKDPHATSYYLRYRLDGKRQCPPAGNDLLEAENQRKSLEIRLFAAERSGARSPEPTGANAQAQTRRIKIVDAVSTYFANLEAQGKDPKSIRTYKIAVDGFVASCSKMFVDEIEKQDVFNYLGWLRKQPQRKRKHSNRERTYFNKVSHVAIFLKAFGKSNLLKSTEYPTYDEKPVKAHTDAELNLLYAAADDKERFLLDFFLGIAVRDGEAAHAEYTDLTGNVLEIKRKPHLGWNPKKHVQRKVTIPQVLADAIRERQTASSNTLIFPDGVGKPNQHLLRDLQDLATKAGANFHTELHRLRKTCATRWAKHLPVHRIQQLLGHKSLETTQRYLADCDLEGGEMQRAVDAAMFQPSAK